MSLPNFWRRPTALIIQDAALRLMFLRNRLYFQACLYSALTNVFAAIDEVSDVKRGAWSFLCEAELQQFLKFFALVVENLAEQKFACALAPCLRFDINVNVSLNISPREKWVLLVRSLCGAKSGKRTARYCGRLGIRSGIKYLDKRDFDPRCATMLSNKGCVAFRLII